MQRLNAISQLTLHTGHTNARYMQHGQDAITTVECKVQSFQSALRCREERVVLLGSKQPSLDHWSCHHPLLLTVGGGLLESYFSNIYFQQILLKGCHVVRMMMMVMARMTVLKYFSLSIYCKYFLRSISLLQSDGEDELKKRQLMELAIINGTYRDSSSKNSSRKSSNLNWMNALESSTIWHEILRTFDAGLFFQRRGLLDSNLRKHSWGAFFLKK